ncbi:MAG: M20/M25/M40 family metallo-hydrolase [Thermomicrobiales bacterium]
MDQRAMAFLRDLLAAASPSGYESEAVGVWRREAETFAAVDHDVLGNAYARLGTGMVERDGPARPVVLIEGHIDEIGLLITHVDESGYLWFQEIGGWDAQVLPGQRVRIAGTDGPVAGVIGRKAAHIVRRDDDGKATKTRDLWIDIGAAGRAAALARVSPGDPAVVEAPFLELTDDLIVSRALDNRVGAFVALESLRLLSEDPPAGVEVVALAAVQEEVSFAGATTAAYRVAPAVAIAIDVTHATDYPEADKKADGEVRLGGGPVLTRGASINPVVFAGLRRAAGELGLDCPVQGAPRASGTDADAMIKVGPGTATGLVSIPNRYMHSPNEMVSLADLDAAATLIATYVRTITAGIDFRP